MFALRASFLLLGVLTILAVAPIQGCSPPEGGQTPPIDDMAWKMLNSDIVLFGIASNKVMDQRFPGENVYSVNFEVNCVYKRPADTDILNKININEIGEIPGHCYATDITIGSPVLVYLTQDKDTSFKASFSSNTGDRPHLDELSGMCDFNPEIPIDMNPDARDATMCPSSSEEECYTPTEEELMPPPLNNPSPPPPPGPDDVPKGLEVTSDPDGKTGSDDKPPSDQEGKEVPYDASKSKEEKSTAGKDDKGNGSASLCVSLLLLPLTLLSVLL